MSIYDELKMDDGGEESKTRKGNRGQPSTKKGSGMPGDPEKHPEGGPSKMKGSADGKPRSGSEARKDSTGSHDSMAAAKRHQSLAHKMHGGR